MGQRVRSSAVVGIEAVGVDVEVQLGKGIPGFDLVGLAEAAVRESRVRVRAAIAASGFELAPRHVILNLAPGDLKKRGAHFDLAIAVALLAAHGVVLPTALETTLFVGELSLAGELRPVRGLLPMLLRARLDGCAAAIVPPGQDELAACVEGVDVRVAPTLRDVVDALNGQGALARPTQRAMPAVRTAPDLADVRGQALGKRALEIAAAGRHNLLFVGPPGAGKTMLARRLVGLLPAPTHDEAIAIASIASLAGVRAEFGERPFRAPHHTASAVALVGGGEPIVPGEVTLAHHGVLFLDELPELGRAAIESLRTVMESGEVAVTRARERVRLPAATLVVGAMNPCPCGYHGDTKRVCRCPPPRVDAYRTRVSGPILDRFDLHVWLPAVAMTEVARAEHVASSDEVRVRVEGAARRRVAHRGPGTRGDLPGLVAELRPAAHRLLERASHRLGLSLRGITRTLRVARTIAHLDAASEIEERHLAEALLYRPTDGERARPVDRSSGAHDVRRDERDEERDVTEREDEGRERGGVGHREAVREGRDHGAR